MESAKEHSIPLIHRNGLSSSLYSDSEPGTPENGNQRLKDDRYQFFKTSRSNILSKLLIVLLIVIGISQSIVIARISRNEEVVCRQSLSGAIPMKNVNRQIYTENAFVSSNETEASAAWNAIAAGHGTVSVDPEWAAARGLPPSLIHPVDGEKVVYNIAAYHAIHCLKFIRQHYLVLLNGGEVDWEMPHELHCFDSLRQSIMCTADDNLLYSTGHKDAGHGQIIQCKDWDTLRDWATERTACYHDHKPSLHGHRWGRCDGGHDGLPHNSLLG